MRAGFAIVIRVWAGALALLVALTLGGAPASAHDTRVVEPPARPTPAVAVFQATHVFATVACGAQRCGLDGDQCRDDLCCGGHGPICGGGLIAPASIVVVAPFLSSERLNAGRPTEMAGLAMPPDEPPPRTL